MYLGIGSTLVFDIRADDLFVAVGTHRADVVATRPELATPEHALHLGAPSEDLFCGDTFGDLDDGTGEQ